MKTMMNLFVLVLVALSFAACEKVNNPVTPVSTDKSIQTSNAVRTYNGTFNITYKDYKNSSRTVSASGSIRFKFNTDETYSYSAIVVSSEDNEFSTSLHDKGTYTLKENQIQMIDDAAKLMNPIWQPSMYLSGTYSYRRGDSEIIIEGSGDYGTISIILENQ